MKLTLSLRVPVHLSTRDDLLQPIDGDVNNDGKLDKDIKIAIGVVVSVVSVLALVIGLLYYKRYRPSVRRKRKLAKKDSAPDTVRNTQQPPSRQRQQRSMFARRTAFLGLKPPPAPRLEAAPQTQETTTETTSYEYVTVTATTSTSDPNEIEMNTWEQRRKTEVPDEAQERERVRRWIETTNELAKGVSPSTVSLPAPPEQVHVKPGT